MIVVQTRDTMSPIYLDAVKIRQEVFVKEQKVPQEIEIDKNEAYAIHFVLYNDLEKAVATVRLLPLDETTLKLQRMAVLKEFRGYGFGRLLLMDAERFAKQQNFKEIKLGAQITAVDFYHSLGFQAEGPNFFEAGIEHTPMHKEL